MTSDQLEALGEEIATFAARIDIAEHALLTRLRLFDAHEAWGPMGFLSCAHWLSWRIAVSLKTAREKVRVARALEVLTNVDASFGRGELSYSKVRAITRVATTETEQHFLDVAAHATAAQLERLTRSYQRSVELCRDPGDLPGEMPRSQRRFVRQSPTLGGMVRIEMQLTPEEAALVWQAMLSAKDGQASAGASGQASAGASAKASAQASAGASA
ncbi:DUF222 domain-containing protein, partial [Enhygromyxa salina]|uniref:DUF222 domain-containing protein n=1 Tax=Enhygromyxa salina TaxID=215803 RepID=UPI0015E6D2CC